jgi:tetratricopeptide (TPR) repeat protein
MGSGLSNRRPRWTSAFLLMALMCLPVAASARQTNPPPAAQSLDAEAFRIQAMMHHEMALLYLEKGMVDKAVAEARQIIPKTIPPELEEAVAMSMSIITDKLASASRFDLAQTLLDETLKVSVQLPARVKILKNKSRLFLLAGEDDKAIELWKRAQELEARIGK